MNDITKPIEIFKNHTLNKSKADFDFNHILNNEPLIDIADYGIKGACFYAIDDGSNYPYCKKIADSKKVFLRKTVAEKLYAINQKLNHLGLELYLFDGWRSLQTQKELWKHFLNEAKKITQSNNQKDLEKFASQFCSNPHVFNQDDFRTCPVHTTGGAVDLTLCRIENGELLDMGSFFDEPSEKSSPDWFEKNNVSNQICSNRRILFNSMLCEEFVYHPNEWWHFDYGNILWVCNNLKNKAFYGYIKK